MVGPNTNKAVPNTNKGESNISQEVTDKATRPTNISSPCLRLQRHIMDIPHTARRLTKLLCMVNPRCRRTKLLRRSNMGCHLPNTEFMANNS